MSNSILKESTSSPELLSALSWGVRLPVMGVLLDVEYVGLADLTRSAQDLTNKLGSDAVYRFGTVQAAIPTLERLGLVKLSSGTRREVGLTEYGRNVGGCVAAAVVDWHMLYPDKQLPNFLGWTRAQGNTPLLRTHYLSKLVEGYENERHYSPKMLAESVAGLKGYTPTTADKKSLKNLVGMLLEEDVARYDTGLADSRMLMRTDIDSPRENRERNPVTIAIEEAAEELPVVFSYGTLYGKTLARLRETHPDLTEEYIRSVFSHKISHKTSAITVKPIGSTDTRRQAVLRLTDEGYGVIKSIVGLTGLADRPSDLERFAGKFPKTYLDKIQESTEFRLRIKGAAKRLLINIR